MKITSGSQDMTASKSASLMVPKFSMSRKCIPAGSPGGLGSAHHPVSQAQGVQNIQACHIQNGDPLRVIRDHQFHLFPLGVQALDSDRFGGPQSGFPPPRFLHWPRRRNGTQSFPTLPIWHSPKRFRNRMRKIRSPGSRPPWIQTAPAPRIELKTFHVDFSFRREYRLRQ